MSELRIREEEIRKPKRVPIEDRERVIDIIRSILLEDSHVKLAIIHGGFINSEVFRDIDIALLLEDVGDELIYVEELRDRLEKATGIGVDIQLLNKAPPSFTYRVLHTGKVLVEREPGIVAITRVHTLEEMKRLKKLLHKQHQQYTIRVSNEGVIQVSGSFLVDMPS